MDPDTQPRRSINNLPRPDIALFFVQAFVLVITVCFCLVNLTLYGTSSKLWYMILTWCLGYLVPNPNYKVLKDVSDITGEENGFILRDPTVERRQREIRESDR